MAKYVVSSLLLSPDLDLSNLGTGKHPPDHRRFSSVLWLVTCKHRKHRY
jgi:hypothetical protein